MMGFGRVGRQVFRLALDDDRYEVVAVSDIGRAEILHHLLTKSMGSRLPVPDGSVVDLFVELKRPASVEGVHEAVRAAADSPRMKNVLEFTREPVVSSDIIGNPHSSIYDASFTQVTGGRYLKALCWYDNEWGYSNRVCDLLATMAELE